MKLRYFRIHFSSGPTVKATAFCPSEAKILAQAERIKAGMIYAITKWEEITRDAYLSDNQ